MSPPNGDQNVMLIGRWSQ